MPPQILIVDDDAKNRDVLVILLKEQGVQSVPVASPLQLNKVLAEIDHLDAVFLDLEMPHMNGYDAFKLLKHYPVSQNVPVVAYTVHVSHVNAVQDAGFHSFLAKPIDPERFPEQLRCILNGQSVWEI